MTSLYIPKSNPIPPQLKRKNKEQFLLSFLALFNHIHSHPQFTSHELESLGLWSVNNTRMYISLLHKNRVIHISSWIPPKHRGSPTKVYSLGSSPDISYISKTRPYSPVRERVKTLSAIDRMIHTPQFLFPT